MHVLLMAYSSRGNVEQVLGLAVRLRTFDAEATV